MQILRIISWMAVSAIIVSLVLMNLQEVDFNFWPLSGGAYLHVRSGVGLIAVAFFLLGLLPMWVLSRAGKWQMNRKMRMLERRAEQIAAPSLSTENLAAENPENPAN